MTGSGVLRRAAEDVDLVRRRVVDGRGDERRVRHARQLRPGVGREVVAVDRVQRRAGVLGEVVAAEDVDEGAVGGRCAAEDRLRQRSDVHPVAGGRWRWWRWWRWRRRRRRRRWRWRRPAALDGSQRVDETVPEVVVRDRRRRRRRPAVAVRRDVRIRRAVQARLRRRRCPCSGSEPPARGARRRRRRAGRPSRCR